MMTTQPLNALILYSVVSPGVRKCVGSQPCFDYFPLLLDVLCLQRAYWAGEGTKTNKKPQNTVTEETA